LFCTHNRAKQKKKKNDSFGQVLKHLASLLVVLRKPLFCPPKKKDKTKKKAARDWLFVVHKIGPKEKILSGRSSNSGQVSLLFLESFFLITIRLGSPGFGSLLQMRVFFLALFFLQRCFLQTPVFLRCGKGGGDGGVKAGGGKGRGGWR
jgi:hypothetical protein